MGGRLIPPATGLTELKKRTLINLYNPRPTWLQLAHQNLDATIAAAYRWEEGLGRRIFWSGCWRLILGGRRDVRFGD